MAESVDALVSNTSGATHPGSSPGLGTESESSSEGSDFLFSDDKKNNLVQRGRCTSYSYPYLPEKAIIGGTAPPPYHSSKEL